MLEHLICRLIPALTSVSIFISEVRKNISETIRFFNIKFMGTKYRLIYFNVTGLGEPIRYLLSYGKIPFEDYRLNYSDWLQYKEETPFGQIPVLEINGKAFNQSSALCRYLAKKVKLLGDSDWDAFQCDVIVDTLTDFRLNYSAYFKLETEREKHEKLKEIKEIHNPFYFNKFEKIVKENGGFFVNNKLTWADLYFSALSDLWIKVMKEPILDDFPALKVLKNKVDSEPTIKEYRNRRPETLY